MVPQHILTVYRKVLNDAAKDGNRQIRDEFLSRKYGEDSSITKSVMGVAMRIGWNPLRPNFRGKTGLGFTLSDIDAHRLRNDQELLGRVSVQAVQKALIKHKAEFLPMFLKDVLTTPQDESFYNPPKWDPSVSRFRNIWGRFSKSKYE